MIDVHSHLFNLAYLPIEGVLRAWGVPAGLAAPTARLLDRLTRVDEIDSEPLDDRIAGAFRSPIEITTADLVLDIVQAVSAAELAAMHDDLAAATAVLDTMDAEAASAGPGDLPPALLLELDLLGTDRERLARVLHSIGRLIGGAEETLRWILLMLNRESVLVEQLLATWPDVRLFVHHMMDMQHHYHPGACRFEFVGEQVGRMQALVARYPGRFATFVAFNPFRDNALEVVRDAVERRGAWGVKFYPPNGYKPVENRDEDLVGARGEEVNRRNIELFRWCVDGDVPLLTHCTPQGMESRPGITGGFSHPKRWRKVLETEGLATLRLCLGHAGGEEGWVAPHSAEGELVWAASYAREVVELCARYPNVFCELGHLECLLQADLRAKFVRRLERVIEAYGDAFGSKVMYGSDWHLVARVPDCRELPRVLRAAVRGSEILAEYERAWFTDNAVRFLAYAAAAGRVPDADGEPPSS